MEPKLAFAGRPGVLSLNIRERTALYAAYMPFLKGGGIFIPTNRAYKIGDEVFMLLSLMDDPAKVAVQGTVVWITSEGVQGNRTQGIGVQFTNDESIFGGLDDHMHDLLTIVLALPRPFLVNINLPPKPQSVVWTRQSVRHYHGTAVLGSDPMGRQNYWLNTRALRDPEEGTDRWAVDHGYTAITPLRLDLTDEACLKDMGGANAPAAPQTPT